MEIEVAEIYIPSSVLRLSDDELALLRKVHAAMEVMVFWGEEIQLEPADTFLALQFLDSLFDFSPHLSDKFEENAD